VRDSVVVDGVGKTYASGVEAIREARFRVVPGEFLSLLGPALRQEHAAHDDRRAAGPQPRHHPRRRP